MESRTFNILNWVTIVIVIGIAIFIIFLVKSESGKCLANPMPYAIKNLEKANNNFISCVCTIEDFRNPSSVYVNSSGIYKTQRIEDAFLPSFSRN